MKNSKLRCIADSSPHLTFYKDLCAFSLAPTTLVAQKATSDDQAATAQVT